MKNNIILSAFLVSAFVIFIYIADATTTHNAPPGTSWMLNGQPVIGTYNKSGTFVHVDELPNGYRVYCEKIPWTCYQLTSAVLTIFDTVGKSPSTTLDGLISYDDIQYYTP